MQKLGWKQSYSVGVEEIDRQHQRLLEIINDFEATRLQPAVSEDIFVVLNSLIKYADEHFATEERYLVKYDFPQTVQHQKEHVQFTIEVFKLAQRLSKHDPNIREEITDFLLGWYRSHVLETDQRYKDHIRKKMKEGAAGNAPQA